MDVTSSPPLAAGQPAAPRYHAFLLRLWCGDDGAGWHASLQAPAASERRGFADLDGLIGFLRTLCGLAGSDPDPPPGEP